MMVKFLILAVLLAFFGIQAEVRGPDEMECERGGPGCIPKCRFPRCPIPRCKYGYKAVFKNGRWHCEPICKPNEIYWRGRCIPKPPPCIPDYKCPCKCKTKGRSCFSCIKIDRRPPRYDIP